MGRLVNTARLHSLLDYATPTEHEAAFYANPLPSQRPDPTSTAGAGQADTVA